MKPQVLIVGAGPVGLTMAAELARYGVAVRIVDKAAARTDKSKALVLWSRTLELLDRAGCSGAFVAAGQKMVAANIIAGNKLIGHISIATVNSPYPYALMLPQSETERLLEEHLNRQAVTVERQVEVTSFASSESSVTSVLRKAGGQEETLTTEWLIGCDGAHSMVRHGLGLSFEGDTLPSDWALADIHLKGYPFGETELATYWRAGCSCFFSDIAGPIPRYCRHRSLRRTSSGGPDARSDSGHHRPARSGRGGRIRPNLAFGISDQRAQSR